MKTIRILCMLVLSACAHTSQKSIDLDPVRICMPKTYGYSAVQSKTVSEKTLRASIRAVEYWNDVLGCRVFNYSSERPLIQFTEVDRIPAPDDVLDSFYEKTTRKRIAIIRKTYVATTNCVKRAIIYITIDYRDKHSEWKLETVYRHELGHALGLKDIPYQAIPSLMAPITKYEIHHPIDANPKDIEALRKIHCGE